MSVIKWDQDQKQVNIMLAIVVLRVCTGHVLLVLTGFLVSTSASSFFPIECLPHFSPLFFLPSFCMTWFCMSRPWFSSSALFSLFWVQNLCTPCLYSLLKHDQTFLFSIIKYFSLHALCFLYLILSVLCFLWTTYHSLPAVCRRTAVTNECCSSLSKCYFSWLLIPLPSPSSTAAQDFWMAWASFPSFTWSAWVCSSWSVVMDGDLQLRTCSILSLCSHPAIFIVSNFI